MSNDDVDVGKALEDFTRTADVSKFLAQASSPKAIADATERYAKEHEEKRKEQERLRFQHAVRVGYDLWDREDQLELSPYVCRRCGVLVIERETHQRWHDGQDEVNQKADSAYWHDQPIG